MVGFILSVVILKYKRGSLDSVVMWLAALKPACPCKIDVPQTCLLDFSPILRGDIGTVAANVFLDQAGELGGLFRGHLTLGQPFGFAVFNTLRIIENFLGRLDGKDGRFLLLVAERFDQQSAKFFLTGENPRPFSCAFANLARVGAKKGGRHRWGRVTGGGEIERKVVSFHAPAPDVFIAGSAKDGDIIELRITDWRAGFSFFKFREHGLQTHD